MRPPTHFGQALEELGIASIVAHSPQAKGRVERLFATLQDRLVCELRLSGVSSLADANAFLQGYLPRFNAQFAVPAPVAGSAYRPLEPTQALEAICCFKYARVVAADNTIAFAGQRLQLQPSRSRRSYAHAQVEVQERLDGSLAVCYQGQLLQTREAPPEAPAAARPARLSRPPSPAVGLLPPGTEQEGRSGTAAGPPSAGPSRSPLRATRTYPSLASSVQTHSSVLWTKSLNT